MNNNRISTKQLAEELAITTECLRTWVAKGLVKPSQRGKGGDWNYWCFETLKEVCLVRHLKFLGFSYKMIIEILRRGIDKKTVLSGKSFYIIYHNEDTQTFLWVGEDYIVSQAREVIKNIQKRNIGT